MAEVNVPIVGKVPKGWVIGVTGVSVVIIGYAWIRHRNAAAASAAGVSSGADATAGIDPATGQPIGSAADEAALASMQGGFGGGFFGGGFGGGGGGGQGGGNLPGPGSFTSNAEWAQYAEQQLSGIVSEASLSAALGKYLTGGAVTPNQHSLIDQAIAIAGYPPTAGPGNFPPAVKVQPQHKGGGQGGHGHKPVRHVATGNESLENFAHRRHTTVEHIRDVTLAPTTPISTANRERFTRYWETLTPMRPMPFGLVFYTSN